MRAQNRKLYRAEDMPLVTILMVCYRKFENVYETLDSVFEQDYSNYELIVADDGSENFPKEAITEYINKYAADNLKRLLVYSNERNLGTVRNCNVAIKKSMGKYIIGIAPDDAYAGKDVVSSIVKEFQSSNALVLTSKKEIVMEDGIKTGRILPDENTQHKIESMNPDELYLEMWKGLSIAGAGTYYDRQCFERYKLFDERFFMSEDRPMCLYMLKNQHKIHFLDKITMRYRLGGVSTSKIWPEAIFNDLRNVYHYIGYPDIRDYIRELIDLQKKQVIYGTGSESNRILAVLRIEGIEPLCYMVSDGFSTENAKNEFSVYQTTDFPFKEQEVQILVSEVQTEAEMIIDNLKRKSFSVAVINDLSLSITGFYIMVENIYKKQRGELSQ